MRDAAANGTAYDATVHAGPPATPQREQAIREEEAAQAQARVALLEAKAADLQRSLDEARAEAARLRQRAQGGAA